jgi:predicted kinase
VNSNNSVYLLVGQRGAGKSVYAERILSQQPEVSIISRDALLMKLFGSTTLNPYSGGLEHGGAMTKDLLHQTLSTKTNLKLIFDYWTGESRERRSLNQWLRRLGAEKVVALYFVTSLPLVNEWFWKKPGIAKTKEMRTRPNEGLCFFSEDAPSSDYKAFHELASDIDSDGFDEVIRINPLEPVITL